MTEAEIGHSNALPFKYGEHNLADGDILNIGNIKIKVLYTPGHTNESLCYVVFHQVAIEAALMVFSGDTLFAGFSRKNRPLWQNSPAGTSRKTLQSLHEKLLPIGDDVLVYPAHGAGSVCGHSIRGQEPTTIGYEKKTNPYLQLSKEEFVQKVS